MLRSLVLLAVVCLAAADESPVGAGLRAFVEPRLVATSMRIGRLERVIKDLKHEIDEAAKIDPQGFIDEVNARLDGVKKPRCGDPRRNIPCGRDSVECVSTLLLCDGQEDCHNGWDEDEHTCSAGPMKVGNVLSGTVTWTHCKLRKDHPVQFQITAVAKPKFFGARLVVRARLSADYEEGHEEKHRTYDLKGYYVYGRKRLVLLPVPESKYTEKMGLLCSFNHGDDKRAECKLVQEATLSECANVFLTIQDD
jgi:hypothetical protein